MDRKGGHGSLKSWLILSVALLDDIAVLGFIFLILYFLGVKIPVPALIVIILLIAVGVFFLHRALVRVLRKRLVTGAEGMIGAYGKAVETLDPSGMVDIKGEYWKAFSPHAKIEKGHDVEVVGINGLTLEVKEKDSD